MKKINTIVALTSLLISLPASAHFIWLEQADGQTKLYFGEYESGLREKAGGKLDSIASPQAFVLDAKATQLTLIRGEDFIAVEGPNSQSLANQTIVAQELSMKVKDMTKYHYGIAKPMYYARIGNGKAEGISDHALDIQPLGDNKVRVNLNGKPLAKTKLTVMAPNRWLQELDVNEQGEVKFETPWTGLYVLEVIHLEPSKGMYQGDAYENIRHVSTLSVIKK
jgi:hypothetical protein